MLDQSFSSKTFQEIYDKENRKGNNIEEKFKDDFEDSIKKLKELMSVNKQLKVERDIEYRKNLYLKRKNIKQEREILISKILEKTAEDIGKQKIKLLEGENYGGQSYTFEKTISNFFISKKIQENINETYDVKQASRYSILSELINIIGDKFPKYIIRTDIKNFYESIPQKNLLEKINYDYLLSIKTKEYINQIFESYNILTGQEDKNKAKGVPRGIGISAYLSELFMRKIDNKISELDDLVYYARYVDDIIAIFIPNSKDTESGALKKYLVQIKQIIKDEAGNEFKLNKDKTKEYNLLKGISSLEFEKHNYLDGVLQKKEVNRGAKYISFLGYKIGYLKTINRLTSTNNPKTSERIHIELSEKKIDRYKEKIELSFKDFNDNKNHNRKYAFKLLKARICYLTSNTKLRNNKDKVFVGIYYSNPFLNSDTSLEVIQRSLKYYIGRAGLTIKEKNEMLEFSFLKGYKEKVFYLIPLSNKKYKNYNCKRNDNRNKNNKGIIQIGLQEINSIWKNK